MIHKSNKSSLDKIFYKFVYHNSIYMCDFLLNLDDLFTVICTIFRKIVVSPDTLPRNKYFITNESSPYSVANMASYAISSSLILVINDNVIIGTNNIVLACLCRHF
jgi:hypothetical protein